MSTPGGIVMVAIPPILFGACAPHAHARRASWRCGAIPRTRSGSAGASRGPAPCLERRAFGVLQRESQLFGELIDPGSVPLPRAVGLEAHVPDPASPG